MGVFKKGHIKFEDLAKIYIELHAKPNKRSFKRDERSIKFLNRSLWGKKLYEITPVKKVKLFREYNEQVRYFEEDEMKRLLEACKPELSSVVLLALSTGMRRGEISNLKWQDIDFHRKIIHIEQTRSGERRDIPNMYSI